MDSGHELLGRNLWLPIDSSKDGRKEPEAEAATTTAALKIEGESYKKMAEEELKKRYREVKKQADKEAPPKCCANEACGVQNDDLLACANCRSVLYCSRDCQIKHWKGGHKKVCKELANAHCEAVLPDNSTIGSVRGVPRFGVALAPDITHEHVAGKPFLILIPAWDLENPFLRSMLTTPESIEHHKAQALKSIKYFFKMFFFQGAAKITRQDMGVLCFYALVLLCSGHTGVRFVAPSEAMERSNFVNPYFISQSPMPKGWKPDPTKVYLYMKERNAVNVEQGTNNDLANDPEFTRVCEI